MAGDEARVPVNFLRMSRSERTRAQQTKWLFLSVNPSGEVATNAVSTKAFLDCNPKGTYGWAVFGRDEVTNDILIGHATEADLKDPDAVVSKIMASATGRRLTFSGSEAFWPSEFPLMREGTVHFDVEVVPLDSGEGSCLRVILKSIRRAPGNRRTKADDAKAEAKDGKPAATAQAKDGKPAATAQAKDSKLAAKPAAAGEQATGASQAAANQSAADQAPADSPEAEPDK
jgi:hypothetical protein